eukprot:6471289-Amphidinium_carterae.1
MRSRQSQQQERQLAEEHSKDVSLQEHAMCRAVLIPSANLQELSSPATWSPRVNKPVFEFKTFAVGEGGGFEVYSLDVHPLQAHPFHVYSRFENWPPKCDTSRSGGGVVTCRSPWGLRPVAQITCLGMRLQPDARMLVRVACGQGPAELIRLEGESETPLRRPESFQLFCATWDWLVTDHILQDPNRAIASLK